MNRPKDAESSPEAETPEKATERPEDMAADPRPTDEGTSDDAPRMADDPAMNEDWRNPEDEARESEAREAHEPEIEEPKPAEPERASARDEADHDDHDHDDHGAGTATRLLVLLVVVIVAAFGALYAAPKLAPHVPAGVAKYLVPGEAEAAERIDALSASLASAEERIAGLEAALEARASADALTGVAAEVAAIAGRIEAVEATASGLADQIAALPAPAPVAAPAAEPALEPQVETVALAAAADLAALAARLDEVAATAAAGAALAPDVEAIRADIAAVTARIDAIEAAREGEIERIEDAVRASALETATAALADMVTSGAAYGAELAEVEKLAEQPAPDAVKAGADGSVASAAELKRALSGPAQAAIAADIRVNAGEGVLSQVGAWARSQVIARPTTAREGEGVAEILSRIDAALSDGDIAAAEAEAAALPEHAAAEMTAWLEGLAARAALDAAYAEWTSGLGAGG